MAERLVEWISYKHDRKESCVWLCSVVMMHGPANLGPLIQAHCIVDGDRVDTILFSPNEV